jgi:hypothetical protein
LCLVFDVTMLLHQDACRGNTPGRVRALDRRTIDVLDVAGGRRLRTISFELAVEDQIEDFAFSPDGARCC